MTRTCPCGSDLSPADVSRGMARCPPCRKAKKDARNATLPTCAECPNKLTAGDEAHGVRRCKACRAARKYIPVVPKRERHKQEHPTLTPKQAEPSQKVSWWAEADRSRFTKIASDQKFSSHWKAVPTPHTWEQGW